jgi:Uma2 family endonuclease
MNIDAESWPRTHRLTVDEYYRMAEVGLLAPDARVELIEGEIIDMPPIGSRHALTVDLFSERLIEVAKRSALVRTQGALRLGVLSEPQPDIALLKRQVERYAQSHPTAEDVLPIIEVSDTTLRFDREVKASLYARHGIPEYWIVDLSRHRLHMLRDPGEGQYAEAFTLAGGSVRVPVLEVDIDLAQLML